MVGGEQQPRAAPGGSVCSVAATLHRPYLPPVPRLTTDALPSFSRGSQVQQQIIQQAPLVPGTLAPPAGREARGDRSCSGEDERQGGQAALGVTGAGRPPASCGGRTAPRSRAGSARESPQRHMPAQRLRADGGPAAAQASEHKTTARRSRKAVPKPSLLHPPLDVPTSSRSRTFFLKFLAAFISHPPLDVPTSSHVSTFC